MLSLTVVSFVAQFAALCRVADATHRACVS